MIKGGGQKKEARTSPDFMRVRTIFGYSKRKKGGDPKEKRNLDIVWEKDSTPAIRR